MHPSLVTPLCQTSIFFRWARYRKLCALALQPSLPLSDLMQNRTLRGEVSTRTGAASRSPSMTWLTSMKSRAAWRERDVLQWPRRTPCPTRRPLSAPRPRWFAMLSVVHRHGRLRRAMRGPDPKRIVVRKRHMPTVRYAPTVPLTMGLKAIKGSSADPVPRPLFKFGAGYKLGHRLMAFEPCSAM